MIIQEVAIQKHTCLSELHHQSKLYSPHTKVQTIYDILVIVTKPTKLTDEVNNLHNKKRHKSEEFAKAIEKLLHFKACRNGRLIRRAENSLTPKSSNTNITMQLSSCQRLDPPSQNTYNKIP